MAAARDRDGRLVMVKRAAPGPGADRLRREAAALEAAAGAGCVSVLELAVEGDGSARLTTAWVGGGSLATVRPLEPPRLLDVARALATSLAELHRRGVVHGAIGPDHVLLDGDRPVLCGLGGARIPGEDTGPTPDDDVGALLVLLAALLGDARGSAATHLRAVVAAGIGGGAAAVAARLAAGAPPPASPAREVRPRRRAPERSRPPVRAMAVTAAVAVVLLGVAVLLWRDRHTPDAPAVAPPTSTTSTARPCPRAPSDGRDLDGDGCAEAVAVRNGVVTAGGRRWRVAAASDLAAVGDWDCDGTATAAVVRPSTGEVWVYAAWATEGRPVTASPGPAVTGTTAARAVSDDEGCARLEVTTTGGSRRLVDLG